MSVKCLIGIACVLMFSMAEAEERAPGTRDEVSLNGVELAFRFCPPGEFLMGSSKEARTRYEDTFVPRHRVRLTRGFWLQEAEVTQSQYLLISGANPSFWRSKRKRNHPVEKVSWSDAKRFCDKLSQLDAGADYRLPTEAEWEYACRAGTKGPSYGKIGDIAWFFDNTGVGDGTGSHGHRPVRSKKPNGWGLYDMLGNVEEWCSDWYGPSASGVTTNPTGPRTGRVRIVRGGSCFSEIYLPEGGLMAGYRSGRKPQSADRTVGFRVVRLPIRESGMSTNNFATEATRLSMSSAWKSVYQRFSESAAPECFVTVKNYKL